MPNPFDQFDMLAPPPPGITGAPVHKTTGIARSGDIPLDDGSEEPEGTPANPAYPVPPHRDPGDHAMERRQALPPDRNTSDPDEIMPLLHERQRGNNPLPEQAQLNPFDAFDAA